MFNFDFINGGIGDQLLDFLKESDRIEGLEWDMVIGPGKFEAAVDFLNLSKITIPDLANIVNIFQPKARLRDMPGLDVYVGNHKPIPGGPKVKEKLKILLDVMNHESKYLHVEEWFNPFKVHQEYETLHPFTDGNGRSGRLLWAWMMLRKHGKTALDLGFLHMWYYQSLENSR